jgi:hypothetical protein
MVRHPGMIAHTWMPEKKMKNENWLSIAAVIIYSCGCRSRLGRNAQPNRIIKD